MKEKQFEDQLGNIFYAGPQPTLVDDIPAGYYTPQVTEEGRPFLRNLPEPWGDEMLDLNAEYFQTVVQDLDKFWSVQTQEAYERYGLLYRRGILLHGAPGTGKSVLFRRVAQDVVQNRGGIVFWNPDPETLVRHVQEIITRVPDAEALRVLVVFEEFDRNVRHDEASVLNLLDGQASLPNVVYLASTNYLDRIPNRLKNRPSRFARVLEVKVPKSADRAEFFSKKIHPQDLESLGPKGLNKLVKETEGLAIDHLKDIITSVFCLGVKVKEAVKRVKTLPGEEDKPKKLRLEDVVQKGAADFGMAVRA